MKHLTWYVVIPFLEALPVAAETSALSADDWYKNQYAPLYAEKPWDNIEQFADVDCAEHGL